MAANGAPHKAGRRRLLRCAVAAVAIVAGFFAASAADGPVIGLLPVVEDEGGRDFGDAFDLATNDWISMLRLAGFAPTWIIVGVALCLVDVARAKPGEHPFHKFRQLVILTFTVALAGAGAEVLKLITRRERPAVEIAEYVFRPFADRTFYSGGLGLPSSHTAVAFAAMICLWRLYPPAAGLWITLAIGCAMTRVIDGSHYVSDVYVGGLVGVAAGSFVWATHLRRAAVSDRKWGLIEPSAGA